MAIVVNHLLWPFAFLYGLLVQCRNFLYQHNFGPFKGTQFSNVYTLSVGNLRVGGTGKTPHIEYLAELLYPKYAVAILSRGYGRKSKGIRIADDTENYLTMGDEPIQFYHKFKTKVEVIVGEKRAKAIPIILRKFPKTQIILLDDAMQHREVKPHLQIVLTEYDKLFFKDYLLPVGRLREPASEISRADIIIVTKSPADLGYHKEYIKRKLKNYKLKPKTALFFTGIVYSDPIALFPDYVLANYSKAIVLTTIADPTHFSKHVSNLFTVVKEFFYADHHVYTHADYQKIELLCHADPAKSTFVITTEKDMVKMLHPEWKAKWEKIPVFYVPIRVTFIEHEQLFKNMLFGKINHFFENSGTH